MMILIIDNLLLHVHDLIVDEIIILTVEEKQEKAKSKRKMKIDYHKILFIKLSRLTTKTRLNIHGLLFIIHSCK